MFFDSGNLDLNILCSSIFLSKMCDGIFSLLLAANGGTYLPLFYVSIFIFIFLYIWSHGPFPTELAQREELDKVISIKQKLDPQYVRVICVLCGITRQTSGG